MENLFKYLFEDSDENATTKGPLPMPITTTSTDHTVISVGGSSQPDPEHMNEDYGEHESYEEADEYSTEEASHPQDTFYHNSDMETRQWIDHIVSVTQEHFTESHAMISLTYNFFSRYYEHLELNMDALEYVCNESTYNPRIPKSGSFPCIFYNELFKQSKLDYHQEVCRELPNLRDVFLVCKQHHFVYGRVLECALLRRHKPLLNQAYELFLRRRSTVNPCVEEHDQAEKLCPDEYVLYVNVNTEFYAYCSKLLKEDVPCVNFGLTAQYVGAERLSFYQVLFLCGDSLQPLVDTMTSALQSIDLNAPTTEIRSEYYQNINHWRALPVWFLAAYYARHPLNEQL